MNATSPSSTFLSYHLSSILKYVLLNLSGSSETKGINTGAFSKHSLVKFLRQGFSISSKVTCLPKSCAPQKATNSASDNPRDPKYRRRPSESNPALGNVVSTIDLSVWLLSTALRFCTSATLASILPSLIGIGGPPAYVTDWAPDSAIQSAKDSPIYFPTSLYIHSTTFNGREIALFSLQDTSYLMDALGPPENSSLDSCCSRVAASWNASRSSFPANVGSSLR